LEEWVAGIGKSLEFTGLKFYSVFFMTIIPLFHYHRVARAINFTPKAMRGRIFAKAEQSYG